MLFETILSLSGLVSLCTLTLLEIVLGIDNIVFISLITQDLEESKQPMARRLGLILALVFRVIMLLCITWIIGLTTPLFSILEHSVSGRDAILFLGGIFLLYKASVEIVHKTEGKKKKENTKADSVVNAIFQIGLLDIVFSFVSVLTAIGMTDEIVIMITAVVISMLVMLSFAEPISAYIDKHVSLQILALSFLVLIGTVLIAESAHIEIPKPYIYCSVGFALMVQILSIRARRKINK